MASSGLIKRYIAMERTLNRYFAIYKYGFDLNAEQIAISSYNDIGRVVLSCGHELSRAPAPRRPWPGTTARQPLR
ncbi:hypothetical protein EMIT043CA1_140174 [Pseudomonas brassicacearum]